MKKKFISLFLVTVISSTALISCGKTNSSANSNSESATTEQSSATSESEESSTTTATDQSSQNNSKIIGENNKPTVEVKSIASIADFKDKDKNEIEKLLGKAISEEDNKAVYEKDNYNFEITYVNSKCNEIKITPKVEMKYPADGMNILKLMNIDAGESDSISPAGLEWNNKFDTFKINVVSNNEPDGKISYVNIILSDPSNNN